MATIEIIVRTLAGYTVICANRAFIITTPRPNRLGGEIIDLWRVSGMTHNQLLNFFGVKTSL